MNPKMIDHLLTLATNIRSELKTRAEFVKDSQTRGVDPTNHARLHFLDGQLELIEELLKEFP